MSKTLFVEFRDAGFWAYDVVASAHIKFLVDMACEFPNGDPDSWLTDVIQKWRFNAAVSDFGFFLDSDWNDSQIATVVRLCEKANGTINAMGDIPAHVIDSEPILDDLHIFLRNIDPVPHKPVVRFGDGVIKLLTNSLPEPPEKHWWYYNLADELGTMEMGDA